MYLQSSLLPELQAMIKLGVFTSYNSHVECLQSHISHADLEQTSLVQKQGASKQDVTMSYIALFTCSASCLPDRLTKISITKGLSAMQCKHACLGMHAKLRHTSGQSRLTRIPM